MKVDAYVAVFGIVGIVVVAAVAATLLSPQGSAGPTTNLPNYGKAPDFQGIQGWINSPPLSISQLKGKVVLVDFWTYSCINCNRTIQYLNAWYSEYGNEGLVIVGVHTPEFQFERNYSNVLAATQAFGIRYPVALDSNSATWNAYHNEYWPAEYLIDANGSIRHREFGEGNYNETENAIRTLLTSAGYSLSSANAVSSVGGTSVNFSQIGTPELYVGYATARAPIGNFQGFYPDQVVNYTLPSSLQENTVYFSGGWYNAEDSMVASGSGSKVFLIYDAKVVNIVAQGNSSVTSVMLDVKNLTSSYVGSDLRLEGGVATGTIGMARLYNIIDGPSYGVHELEIEASPGFRLFTFTFG